MRGFAKGCFFIRGEGHFKRVIEFLPPPVIMEYLRMKGEVKAPYGEYRIYFSQ
jgi:hypothetical protein